MTDAAKKERKPESRWTAFVAIALALVLYFLIPQKVQPIPNWIVPSIGLVMLIPLFLLNPMRLTKETTWSRWVSISLAILLVLVAQFTIGYTIRELIIGKASGPDVLLDVLLIWVTNVIAFSLVYWELDLGGPVARRIEGTRDNRQIDFRFPQHDGAPGNKFWEPGFIDYAYFSLSNMMAFSPTDVMPMTTRAKLLMGYQALTGFILLALVISRAVNILN
ncbi:MAG: hypothetical protein JWR36_244 [Glaciihabitans sp.]|jgi:uncharacterized membrane protein|nr:hypothetical protein [Glaciihabitans sp.]MDQ1571972.1 hypothetical protein [Actinomycetota bacterium]